MYMYTYTYAYDRKYILPLCICAKSDCFGDSGPVARLIVPVYVQYIIKDYNRIHLKKVKGC